MKRLLLLAFVCVTSVQAQQNNHAYVFNQSALNPAFLSFSNGTNVILSGGAAPAFWPADEFNFSGNTYISSKVNQNNAFDLAVDQNFGRRIFNTSSMMGSYAHQFRLKKGRSIGLGARMNYNSIAYKNLRLINDFDKNLLGNIGLGFDSKNLTVGLSLMTNPIYESRNDGADSRIKLPNSLFIGSKHQIGKNFKINPSFATFLTSDRLLRLDANLNMTFYDRFTLISNVTTGELSINQRYNDAILFGANMLISKNIKVGFINKQYLQQVQFEQTSVSTNQFVIGANL
jgi:hypothetical protein